MDVQKTLSIVALVVGALIFVGSVGLMGTPPTDIGMASTAGVFLLLGLGGLLLARQTSKAE